MASFSFMMQRSTTILFVIFAALVLFPARATAFGAGNIPSVSAIEGKNFRHGDIEDTLAGIVMSTGGFMSALTGGKKFNGMSIKRVYFGNWLRDYSQAVDVGTLSKGIKIETLRVLVWILSFLAFGYATKEYEVTTERLGVYRPEEHIDNPKDYADNKDARQYDSRLRGPVQNVELEIDPQTGMKNYIANERGGWDTSTMFVRYSLERSIHFGRLYKSNGREEDRYESFRLLGQALHCLEDFSAHSNYIELTLLEFGNTNVFPHVGSQAAINLQGKRVYPLVTGTFGSLDFLHSLLGEAQDHLSQTEVDDLDQSLRKGQDSKDSSSLLKSLLEKVPISIPAVNLSSDGSSGYRGTNSYGTSSRGFDDAYPGAYYSQQYSQYSQNEEAPRRNQSYLQPQMTTNIGNEIDRLSADSRASAADAENMSTEEIIKKIYPFLEFRDRIMKGIDAGLEKIPFLDSLIEKISDTLTLFVMGLIAPFVTPLINGVVKQLQSGSQTAVDNKDQEEVWHVPTSHDPTHSYLSKDHFSLYLNEPAGLIAKEVISYVVPMIVSAWDDMNADTNQVIVNVMQVFHHPATASSEIQMRMRQVVQTWLNNLGGQRSMIVSSLSSDGVLAGSNHIGGKRPGGSHSHGSKPNKQSGKPQKQHHYVNGTINSAAQAAGVSQHVNSSGVHMPNAIPSFVPGASYVNQVTNLGKKFGVRDDEQGHFGAQESYSFKNEAGDRYHDQSTVVEGDNGCVQESQYTSTSSSGLNNDYYSSETVYSRQTPVSYSGSSRTDNEENLTPSFNRLQIKEQTSYQRAYYGNNQYGYEPERRQHSNHEIGQSAYQPERPQHSNYDGYGNDSRRPSESYNDRYGTQVTQPYGRNECAQDANDCDGSANEYYDNQNRQSSAREYNVPPSESYGNPLAEGCGKEVGDDYGELHSGAPLENYEGNLSDHFNQSYNDSSYGRQQQPHTGESYGGGYY
ncbi:heterokaryon incompatibility protein Het-C-domain-containing protein [Lipomyces arxii]|uniref:heterokaryon incompatibility protein Het-C-domain-containing protein n=1 Tax=Lipomyces arxii TaxID=56418 RepID=UPI0034CEC070